MGADAVRKLLARLDLVSLSKQLRQELSETSSKQKIKDLTKRLKVVESLRDSDNRPEWMVLECIPVIPPDLRPLVLARLGQLRHQRPERPLPPDHQPQQPAQEAGRPERRPRSSSATRSGCSSRPSTPSSTTTAASGPCWAARNRPLEVADRHDQGQAGAVPREPAGQARRLLGPLGDRRRPRPPAPPVRPAQEDRARALPAVHHPPAQGAGPRRHDQVGQEDARAARSRRCGTSSRRSSTTTPSS